ncbi:hypothetical protein CPB86DRAFT_762176 [Serendipita vermifera]|nr:hypothetical protein CPB86DRAFT_762176 [Serendipita vermifera]
MRKYHEKAVNYEKEGRSSPNNVSQDEQRSSPVSEISNHTARRSLTVDALYKRLNLYHFVLVRGTPASGKSTLAELLADHIRAKEGRYPIVINDWTENPSPRSTESYKREPRNTSLQNTELQNTEPQDQPAWLDLLKIKSKRRYNDKGSNIVIIDEAQLTYHDSSFWNGYFKTIDYTHRDRVILFASYGSPAGRVSAEVVGTPMVIPDAQRVSLRPVDHQDGIPPVGLLFTGKEFDDVVKARYPNNRFSQDFLKFVYGTTAGHIGAIRDMLESVQSDMSYWELKGSGTKYSLETFWTKYSIEKFWDSLDKRSVFRRGLPMRTDLEKPAIAHVLREVLRYHAVNAEMFESEYQDALIMCWKEGWLHSTVQQDRSTVYIFTSPLHRWFVEYFLGTQVTHTNTIMEENLLDFVINVIGHFSRKQLSHPRAIGASNKQRPPEAQFQDEFYRCCHKYSNGSLISFPKFGNATGRIHFYIPVKKWGMELVCEGDGLENHSSRFSVKGAYAAMDFKDYIILDFRTTVPRRGHPGIPNLYHIAFKNDYSEAQILNGSSLEEIKRFVVLNQ